MSKKTENLQMDKNSSVNERNDLQRKIININTAKMPSQNIHLSIHNTLQNKDKKKSGKDKKLKDTHKIIEHEKKSSKIFGKKIEETEFEKLNRELEVLKKEIFDSLNNSTCLRYFIEFEKKEMPFHVKKRKISIQPAITRSLRNLVKSADDYYHEIENLPLHFILNGTKRIVTATEWRESIEEQQNFKMMKKIKKLRKKKFFEKFESFFDEESTFFKTIQSDDSKKYTIDISKNNNMIDFKENCVQNTEKIKKCAESEVDLEKIAKLKILAYEARSFVQKNSIPIDSSLNIIKFPFVYSFVKEKSNTAEHSNTRVDAFHLMNSNRSKKTFKIHHLKKKGACHASHSLAMSKIPFELSRLTKPSEIISFKIARRDKNNHRQ